MECLQPDWRDPWHWCHFFQSWTQCKTLEQIARLFFYHPWPRACVYRFAGRFPWLGQANIELFVDRAIEIFARNPFWPRETESYSRNYVGRAVCSKFLTLFTRHKKVHSLDDLSGVADYRSSEADDSGKPLIIERLHDAVQKLPDTLRKVFVAYYYDKKSVRDLAAEFGLSESAVKDRLYRARKILRGSLDPTGEEPPETTGN
jgi:RNA polymerase sigma-70 factor (ECF subfamily)